MAFFVKFWGTRGSIPTPGQATQKYGGNTSCVAIRTDRGNLFICDGGTGLRELGLELLQRHGQEPVVAHILFSHPHWDHIQGFPFFTPAYQPSNTFYIYGTSAGDQRIYRLLSGQMRSDYFPVNFWDLGAKIIPRDLEEVHHQIEGVTVRSLRLHHPGESWAFSFEEGGNKIVYATDNELDQVLLNRDASLEDLSVRREAPAELVNFLRGADLVIADGQYTDAEYLQKRGWGHTRANTLVDLTVEAGVRQLAVFHHDPMHGDEVVDGIVESCRRRAARYLRAPVIFAARERIELKIG